MFLLRFFSLPGNKRAVRLFFISVLTLLVVSIAYGTIHLSLSQKTATVKEKKDLIRAVSLFASESNPLATKEFYAKSSQSDFVIDLIGFVSKNRLRLISVKPDESEKFKAKGKDFNVLPVTIKLRGDFVGAYQLLRDLEKQPILVIEDGLVVEKIDEDNVDMQLKVLLPLRLGK